ncbi:Receptor-like protein 7 [Linum perenne]
MSLLSLVPLILPVLIVSSHVPLVSGQCREDQQSLLLQLKRGLNFTVSEYSKLVEWNESTDCCEWPGISCDVGGLGRVIGLDLSFESITGGEGLDDSTALFSLQYLESLDLSGNKFNTTIPAAIGNLTNLRYLDLSYAGFFGKIPTSISELTSLTSLRLSCQDCNPKLKILNLTLLVQNLTQLTELQLDGVDLPSQRKEWCHVLSSSLPNLKVLSLANCSLSGPIDPSLSKLQSLSILELDYNNFSSPIPNSLAELKNLTLLSVSNCELIGTFPKKIAQSLTLLETLDLSSNHLQGPIDPSLSKLQSLSTLELNSNNFSSRIPDSLLDLKNLTYLSLRNCELIGIFPKKIVESLTLLDTLDLSNNHLQGPIPRSIFELPSLGILSLSSNRFRGSPLDPSISKLQSLSILELDDNNFSSPIPNSLAELKNLTLLRLRNCELIGTFPQKIAQSLTLLEILDLSNNHLQGPIPRSLFELPSFCILLLSSNRFRGSVQLSWFQTLQNLVWLDLSDNNLTVDASINNSSPSSTFPHLQFLELRSCNLRTFPELGNLSELGGLDLSDNNINGVVPRWVMESTTLKYLSLSHNNLVGFEVHYFSSSVLELLDMHDNQLEGNFPFISSPIYIDFSHNHFSGTFPTEFFNNQYFPAFFLSLSNNRFTGIIPTSICNLDNLEVVDFSNNNLNGTIPSCLSKDLNHLSVLDLGGNMLSGKIPDTFQASCALQTLDLSNNQLEGRIPKSLENCTKLEVLDVQQLQIVDLAFNNFSGPLNDKFLDTWEAMMQDGNETHDFIHFQPSVYFGYYQDSIVVSTKGLEWEFEKILTIFKSIDFSSNNFNGPIPEIIGKFKALHVLNLSHNAFTGNIPSEIGDLSNLESLDLSRNKLSGHIPMQLAGLTFLAVMNLSDNYLVGSIPTGRQFQTFENTSFGGNPDLCGRPLTKNCSSPPVLPDSNIRHKRSSTRINWDILSKVFGYVFGLGAIMLPASFWPSFRLWYWPKIDSLLLWMFPKLYVKDWNNRLRQTRSRRKRRSRH